MQFNNKITVIYNSLNEYAEEQATDQKLMRCCIIEYRLKQEKVEQGKKKRFDLKVIAPNRGFEPYKTLFDNRETLLFQYNSKTYEPIMIAAINDFGGKVKYYELGLMEVKSASQV